MIYIKGEGLYFLLEDKTSQIHDLYNKLWNSWYDFKRSLGWEPWHNECELPYYFNEFYKDKNFYFKSLIEKVKESLTKKFFLSESMLIESQIPLEDINKIIDVRYNERFDKIVIELEKEQGEPGKIYDLENDDNGLRNQRRISNFLNYEYKGDKFEDKDKLFFKIGSEYGKGPEKDFCLKCKNCEYNDKVSIVFELIETPTYSVNRLLQCMKCLSYSVPSFETYKLSFCHNLKQDFTEDERKELDIKLEALFKEFEDRSKAGDFDNEVIS